MAFGGLRIALGVEIEEQGEAVEKTAAQQICADDITLLFELIEGVKISERDRFDNAPALCFTTTKNVRNKI